MQGRYAGGGGGGTRLHESPKSAASGFERLFLCARTHPPARLLIPTVCHGGDEDRQEDVENKHFFFLPICLPLQKNPSPGGPLMLDRDVLAELNMTMLIPLLQKSKRKTAAV